MMVSVLRVLPARTLAKLVFEWNRGSSDINGAAAANLAAASQPFRASETWTKYRR